MHIKFVFADESMMTSESDKKKERSVKNQFRNSNVESHEIECGAYAQYFCIWNNIPSEYCVVAERAYKIEHRIAAGAYKT